MSADSTMRPGWRERLATAPFSLSVSRDAVLSIAGTIAMALSQWGMISATARTLDPEAVGYFSFAAAIMTPIFVLLSFSLRPLAAIDHANQFNRWHYTAVRLVTCGAVLSAAALYTAWSGTSSGFPKVLLAFTLLKAIEQMADLQYGFLQQRKTFLPVAKSQLLRGCANLAFFGGVLIYSRSIVMAIFAACAGSLLILMFYDFRGVSPFRSGGGSESRSDGHLWKLVATGVPLGLVSFLLSVTVNIPRYFLEKQHGMYFLGIYSAMAYVLLAGGTVVNGVGQAVLPRIAKAYGENDIAGLMRGVRLLSLFCVIVAVVSICAGATAARPLLSFIYDDRYSNYTTEFFLLMVAGAIQYSASIFGFIATAIRIIHGQTVVALGSVAVALVLSYFLIPENGLLGAAWVMIAVASFQAMFYVLLVVRSLMSIQPQSTSYVHGVR